MRALHILTAFLTVALIGCHVAQPLGGQQKAAGVASRVAASQTASVAAPRWGAVIRGRVDMPGPRAVQATSGDLVTSATVSFLDASNTTVATGKTDSSGSFTLNTGSYPLTSGATYVLEAIKGLNGAAPGSNAARFRTILRWNGTGFQSCTNLATDGSIVINALTTAVAIESALDPANVPPANTIGKVNVSSTPATLNLAPGPYANHPDTEIAQLAADLTANLGGNYDPVASIPAIAPAITSFAPVSGAVGALVQIVGTGFSPIPNANTVKIDGVPASVVLATPTTLIIAVGGSQATSGPVSVTTPRGTATGGTFTVSSGGSAGSSRPVMWIDSLSPDHGRPMETTITIFGQFPATGATPSVNFAGRNDTFVPAAVQSWTEASMSVNVPLGAQPGFVTVQAEGVTTTSPAAFTTWQGDLSTFGAVPNSGAVTGNASPLGVWWTSGNPQIQWRNYVYNVSGGTVIMHQLNTDGSISSARVAGLAAVSTGQPAVCVVGDWFYIMGGYFTTAIQRAAIKPDGTLGPFSVIGNLQFPRYYAGAYNVTGSTIWVAFGIDLGASAAAARSKSIEKYSVDTSTGNLTYQGLVPVAMPWNGSTVGNYYGFSSAWHAGWLWYFQGGYEDSGVGHSSKMFAIWPSGNTYGIYQASDVTGGGGYWSNMINVNNPGNSNWLIYTWSGYTGSTWTNTTMSYYKYGANGQGSPNWYPSGPNNATALPQSASAGWGFVNNQANPPVIYSVGGYRQDGSYTNLIQAAKINADNSLSPWIGIQGSYPNTGAQLLLVNKLWQIGGQDLSSPANSLKTTQYVPVNADGTLGGSATAGPSLNTGRSHFAAVANIAKQTGTNYLYALGGYEGTKSLNSIERAVIKTDGTLGAFAPLPQTLPGPAGLHVVPAAVVGDAIYTFGGHYSSGNSAIASYGTDGIGVLPINGDGSLGTPYSHQVKLPEPTWWGGSPVVLKLHDGRTLVYLISPSNLGGNFGRVYLATFDTAGNLAGISRGPNLVTPVTATAAQRLGNHIYALGGHVNGYPSTLVQRASLNPDGTLNPWEVYSPGNANPLFSTFITGWSAPLQFGDNVYLGGFQGLLNLAGGGQAAAFGRATLH